MVTSVRTDPESVMVTGPKSEVDHLDEVVTEPVDMRGVAGGFERKVRLVEPEGADVSLDTNRVMVIVQERKK